MRKVWLVVCGVVWAASVVAEPAPEERAIRAGQTIAVTMCIACHLVSWDQAVKPVLGPGIPSFEEIANRPESSIDSLSAAMKVATWHDPAMAATLLPMSWLSDIQRAQVASYILSLRLNSSAPDGWTKVSDELDRAFPAGNGGRPAYT
jgi:mono/diheme cytochrome c family protein